MVTSTHTKRHTGQILVGSLLLAMTLILSGCGPIMSLLCAKQKQTDMDCSTDQQTAPRAP
jgi:uncharacterized protein YceK